MRIGAAGKGASPILSKHETSGVVFAQMPVVLDEACRISRGTKGRCMSVWRAAVERVCFIGLDLAGWLEAALGSYERLCYCSRHCPG